MAKVSDECPKVYKKYVSVLLNSSVCLLWLKTNVTRIPILGKVLFLLGIRAELKAHWGKMISQLTSIVYVDFLPSDNNVSLRNQNKICLNFAALSNVNWHKQYFIKIIKHCRSWKI